MADTSLALQANNVSGNDLTTEQQSAKAVITTLLGEYGLEALASRAWDAYLTGKPIEQIMLELRQSPEYKARFPGMDALSKKGRAVSEAEYIQIEKQYVSLFRQAGLPAGFYDSADDFGNFIANEVSPQEMGARLDLARTAMYELPPTVRDEWTRLYGRTPGELMAQLLDPTKAEPLIRQQFSAAAAGAASQMSGYGLLTQNEAETLGLTGRSYEQFEEGFDFLGRAQELFQPIIGENNADTIGRDEQLQATFQGNSAARRRIEKRARERAAAFAGGGTFAATQGGVTGLGSASS